MRTYETITVEHPQEHTVLVTLNRPEVSNAMNTQMGLDLLAVFDSFCAAPNKQRCVVLTGAGAWAALQLPSAFWRSTRSRSLNPASACAQ